MATVNPDFYNSSFYKDFRNDPANMMGTMDVYNSPYFGQLGSGSAGRSMDRAYEQYLSSIGQPVANPMPAPSAPRPLGMGGSGFSSGLGGLMGGIPTSVIAGLDPKAIAANPAGFQQWMEGAQNYYSNAAPAPASAPATGGTSYSFNPTNIAGTGSYDTEDWMSAIGGLFTGGLTGAASAAGINEQVARLRALGGAAATDYGNLAQQAIQGVEFTPYTITTPGLGTVQQTAPGVISQTLTPQQQANVDAAARMQGQLYNTQMPDTSGIQQQAFGNVGGYLTPQENAQLTGLSTLFGGLSAQQLAGYGAPTGLEGTTQQALTGASQGLGQIGAGTEGLTGLQRQYEQAAGQSTGMLGGTTEEMANKLFQQQQAMRTPEQERQALALENRLRAQGRLGTSTAAYGGTPEQLAMAKAIQEQQSADAYQSMINAEGMLSSQQARALGLGSAAGQMAGTVSNLLTADQQRALGLLSAGQQGTQLQDQLLSSQQARATQSAQASSAMAAANQALRQGDVQTAASLFNIGQSAAQLPSTLQTQALQQAGMAQQQALTPAQQQMQQLQQAASLGQQRASTASTAGGMFGNLVGTGLQERLTAESAAAALRGKQYASALDALARQSGTTGSTAAAQAIGNVKGVIDQIKSGYDAITGIFKDVDFSVPDWTSQFDLSQENIDWINGWVAGTKPI